MCVCVCLHFLPKLCSALYSFIGIDLLFGLRVSLSSNKWPGVYYWYNFSGDCRPPAFRSQRCLLQRSKCGLLLTKQYVLMGTNSFINYFLIEQLERDKSGNIFFFFCHFLEIPSWEDHWSSQKAACVHVIVI